MLRIATKKFAFLNGRCYSASKWLPPTKTAFSSEGNFEQPVPIVLVCGEGLNSASFEGYAVILSKLGFSGFIFEPPGQASSVDDVSKLLHADIQSSAFTPPILISHSFSTFICQGFPIPLRIFYR